MLKIKTVTSPTLAAGAFSQTFGEFEKVVQAGVSFDNPFTSALDIATSVAISGVTVTVTVKKQDLSSPGAWANAVTGDVSGVKFVIIVEGE